MKNLRDQAKQLEAMLEQESVIGTSSVNKVSIEMNGNQKILNINIDPVLLNPDKKPELEEAFKEAHVDCLEKIKGLMASKLTGGGLNLPGQ